MSYLPFDMISQSKFKFNSKKQKTGNNIDYRLMFCFFFKLIKLILRTTINF